MTITEAAKLHGVSRSTIYRWLRTGKIQGRKEGRKWVLEDVEPEKAPTPTKPEKAPQNRPEPPQTAEYDRDKHLLLAEFAHRNRIAYGTDEYDEFVRRVTEYTGKTPVRIVLPDWPPVAREPLSIFMTIQAEGFSGQDEPVDPFADRPWTGEHFALLREWGIESRVRFVANSMVPQSEFLTPARQAYENQTPMYDPNCDVIFKEWCEVNGLDWREGFQWLHGHRDAPEIYQIPNPHAQRELREKGYFSATLPCIAISDLALAECYFGLPTVHREQPKRASGHIQPRVRDIPKPPIMEGSETYGASQVRQALLLALGREYSLFGGQMRDSHIVAPTREKFTEWLGSNVVSKLSYTGDYGGRNWDCDDFAEALRVDMSREHGLNCVIVVWGDKHAFNAVVLAGDNGPEIVFVEPQTDGLVTELTGSYSVANRCAVLI